MGAWTKGGRAALVVGSLVLLGCVVLGCGGTNGNLGGWGRPGSLLVGQALPLSRPDNPTTGFTWHINWTPQTAMRLALDQYVPNATPPGSVGGGGTHFWRLEALQPGDVTVTLQHGQWWGGGTVEPPETIVVHISE